MNMDAGRRADWIVWFALVLAGSLLCQRAWSAETPRAAAVQSPGGYVVHHCMDEQGFKDEWGKPLECFSLLVPRGWTFKGGVNWVLGRKDPRLMQEADLLQPASIAFTVSSSQERVAMQAYPGVLHVDMRGAPAAQMGLFPPGSNYMGFVVGPTPSPAEYLLTVALRQRGSLRDRKVIAQKDLPEVARQFAAEERIYAEALRIAGAAAEHRAGAVIIEYEQNGARYREAFITDIAYLKTGGTVIYGPAFVLSVRAPADEFDAWQPYLMASMYSIRFNPLWTGLYRLTVARATAKLNEVREQCARIDAQIAANRARINGKINREFYATEVLVPHKGRKADGPEYLLPKHEPHQMDKHGDIYSGPNFRKDDPDRFDLK